MRGPLLLVLIGLIHGAPVIQGLSTSKGAGPLLIGAFNIKVFGVAKMKDPDAVASLVEILNRYDLVLIQEIRDKSESTIYELIAACNKKSNDPFNIMLSGRLGRTSSKEQYAFFYKASKMRVTGYHQWDADRTQDVFERPPFVVKFDTFGTALGEFGYIVLHAKPDSSSERLTVVEIDALVDVYDGMAAMWGMEDFLLGGDFNADCAYVSEADWSDIRLRTDTRFDWVIGDDVNTRIKTDYDCAYDRLVLGGQRLRSAYVSQSAVPYRFDQDLSLTEEQAADVSDHVPVEMTLN